jgi:hypothetical protein
MLGSDPVRQYDQGLGHTRQGVISLEPVYGDAGGDSTWVNWFFREFVNGAAMEFAYTQAGQENSFTWDAMSKGFDIQMPLIARLRDEHKIRVETLEASGRWFKQKYAVTPVTTFSVDKDLEGSDLKTIWFNSRFYRINIIWEQGTLRVRDIHLFNEHLTSRYETQPATENECTFFTLPFVDGYLRSKPNQLAGLRLKALIDGKEVSLEGGDPVFTKKDASTMHIHWPLKTVAGSFEIYLGEKKMVIQLKSDQSVNWFFDLNTAEETKLPFNSIKSKNIDCSFEGLHYSIPAEKGSFSQPANGAVLRIHPQSNSITIPLAAN